jgi:uncharacterized pyridoxamine 5'-phosphate oxidase family protein
MKSAQEYIASILKLIDATKLKKIEWKRQNPTTLYFYATTSDGSRNLVSIQTVSSNFSSTDLIMLQITNVATKETILSIDSAEFEIRPYLYDLYEEANYSIERKGIDYFDDLVSNI